MGQERLPRLDRRPGLLAALPGKNVALVASPGKNVASIPLAGNVKGH
jgi:hypothetical protein